MINDLTQWKETFANLKPISNPSALSLSLNNAMRSYTSDQNGYKRSNLFFDVDAEDEQLKQSHLSAQLKWAIPFSQFVAEGVKGAILTNFNHPTVSEPFEFDTNSFVNELTYLPNVKTIIEASDHWSQALKVALTSSKMSYTVGTYVGQSSSLPNTYSVIECVIDEDSIVSAIEEFKADYAQLKPVNHASLSEIPKVFRNAFLNLTATTIGLNSVLPPLGPSPITGNDKVAFQ